MARRRSYKSPQNVAEKALGSLLIKIHRYRTRVVTIPIPPYLIEPAFKELIEESKSEYDTISAHFSLRFKNSGSISHEELNFLLLALVNGNFRFNQELDLGLKLLWLLEEIRRYNAPGSVFLPISGLSGFPELRLNFGDVVIAPMKLLPTLKNAIEYFRIHDVKETRKLIWDEINYIPYLEIPITRGFEILNENWLALAVRAISLLRLWQMYTLGRSGKYGMYNLHHIRLHEQVNYNRARLTFVPDYFVEDYVKASEIFNLVCLSSNELLNVMHSLPRKNVFAGDIEKILGDLVINNIAARLSWKQKLNDYEDRLFHAIELFDKSYESEDSREILLYNVMVLELLFNVYQGERIRGIQDSVANTFAMLIRKNPNERKELISSVTHVYKLRSKIVHSWNIKPNLNDVRMSDTLACWGIAVTGMLLNEVSSRKEFEEKIKDKYLSVPAPFWGKHRIPPQ